MNSPDNTPPPEASDPTTVNPEKCNLAEAQDKGFKVAILNMCKKLKEDVNKCLNEDREKHKQLFKRCVIRYGSENFRS